MFVQVVTYSLEGITEEQYLDVANRLAIRIASQPGLQAKLWLENPGGNRYGGVYFWDDLESMERFSNSDLFEGEVPEFGDLRVEEFSVLENLTAMTQPVREIIEPRGAADRGLVQPSPASTSVAKAAHPATKQRTPPARKIPVTTKGATKAAATKAAAKKAPVAKKAAAAPKKVAAAPKKAAGKKARAEKAAWPAKIRKTSR